MTSGFVASDFATGLLVGALGSALFFAGLAIGIRFALARPRSTGWLLASAVVRIALLLSLASLVCERGPAALTGFATAFLLVRVLALALARIPSARGMTPWR